MSLTPSSVGDYLVEGLFYLHSSFKDAYNFTNGEDIISLVTQRVGGGPRNIVLPLFNLVDSLSHQQFLLLKGKKAELINNNHKIVIDFTQSEKILFKSPLHHMNLNLKQLYANVGTFKEYLRKKIHAKGLAFLINGPLEDENIHNGVFEQTMKKRFLLAFDKIVTGSILDGAKMMKGLGKGLTPSGDDFICGMITAFHLRGNRDELIDHLYHLAKGDNLIVNSFLWMSQEGLISERYREIIICLSQKTYPPDLLEIGETSGTDWATGLITGLELDLCQQ